MPYPAPFKDWLQGLVRARVTLEELLRGFAENVPECAGADRREQLWRVLQYLSAEGSITLPADTRQNWDAVGQPRLPRFITLIRAKAERRDFSEVKWVPELNFAPEIRQVKQLENLARINEFLIANRGHLGTLVPFRERALQIFGDEKYFESAVTGDLLYGRLPLAVIGACHPEPPLPREDFPIEGKPLLLVENHHTYWSLLQWNANALKYTSIAYGAGNTIMKSASALVIALQRSGASHAEYFGDLDPAGLAIPAALNKGLAKLGNPPVRPAVALYDLLLSNAIRRPLSKDKRKVAHDYELEWLPKRMKEQVMHLLADNSWLPQEGVSLNALMEMFPVG